MPQATTRSQQGLSCYYRGVSPSYTAEVMPLQSLIASAQSVMPTHSSNTLTLEMIQQMQQLIHSAFSALGLSGKTSNHSVWYLDSGTSNNMTHSADHLSHVKNYDGDLTIHTANDESISTESTAADTNKLDKWETNDARNRIITLILSSVDPQIVLNMRPFKTAKGTWDHMKRVYNQENPARRFQLEHEKSKYTQRNK